MVVYLIIKTIKSDFVLFYNFGKEFLDSHFARVFNYYIIYLHENCDFAQLLLYLEIISRTNLMNGSGLRMQVDL